MRYQAVLSLGALLVSVACNEPDVTGPLTREATGTVNVDGSRSAPFFARSGPLHVTKECSQYTGLAGGFCTITSSNIKEIKVGTKVIYAVAVGGTVLNSDIVLDPPGPGKSTAFGHVVLNLATGQGVVTISGGTGKFTWFKASVQVSTLGRPNWAWDGTYSYGHD